MSALCQKQTFRPLFDMIDGGCTRGGITMKLPRRRFLHVAVGAAAIPAASGVAKAEVYPSRTITMIVPIAKNGRPRAERPSCGNSTDVVCAPLGFGFDDSLWLRWQLKNCSLLTLTQ